jgi:hypothetical protein
MMKTLPEDATVENILPSLTDQDDYVSGLFGKLRKANQQTGNAVVRIGITGKGRHPAYRIEHPGNDIQPEPFDGQLHRAFTDVKATYDENWSTQTMTYQEIEDLLGRLRNFTRKKG